MLLYLQIFVISYNNEINEKRTWQIHLKVDLIQRRLQTKNLYVDAPLNLGIALLIPFVNQKYDAF